MSAEMDPNLAHFSPGGAEGTLDGLPTSADAAGMSSTDLATIISASQGYHQHFSSSFFDPDPFANPPAADHHRQPYYPKRPFPGELADEDDDDADDELVDDPEALKREVKRLRRELRQERRRNDGTSSVGSVDTATTSGWGGSEFDFGGGGSSWSGGTPSTSTDSPFPGGSYEPDDHLDAIDPDRMGGASGLEGVKKRKGSGKPVNPSTGKSQATGRKVALNKAIRDKMRQLMGISDKSPLPDPDDLDFDDGGIPFSRPKWNESVRKPYNKAFLEKVVSSVIDEAWLAIRAHTETGSRPCPIPQEDLTQEIGLKAAKTSLTNFGKRWHAENDAAKVGDLGRDTKRRRRWARKDEKLRKRTKAASDPSCPPKVTWTPSILQIDYMSSEYSSEGEPDNNSPAKMAPGLWDLISGGSMMSGMGESKVLEIRTPRWRSQDLNDVYASLDTIAERKIAAANAKRKHFLQPSYRRFRLNPLRDLPPPESASLIWEYDPSWLGDLSSISPVRAQARERTGWSSSAGAGTSGASLAEEGRLAPSSSEEEAGTSASHAAAASSSSRALQSGEASDSRGGSFPSHHYQPEGLVDGATGARADFSWLAMGGGGGEGEGWVPPHPAPMMMRGFGVMPAPLAPAPASARPEEEQEEEEEEEENEEEDLFGDREGEEGGFDAS